MSTLENLRFYSKGRLLLDNDNPGKCCRFVDEGLAQDAAKLLNESPVWCGTLIWEPANKEAK